MKVLMTWSRFCFRFRLFIMVFFVMVDFFVLRNSFWQVWSVKRSAEAFSLFFDKYQVCNWRKRRVSRVFPDPATENKSVMGVSRPRRSFSHERKKKCSLVNRSCSFVFIGGWFCVHLWSRERCFRLIIRGCWGDFSLAIQLPIMNCCSFFFNKEVK